MALEHSFKITGQSLVISDTVSVDNGKVTTQTGPLYVRVESVNGTKKSVTCRVVFYDKAKDKAVSIKAYSFEPNMNGENFIAQSYDYLKTLPEFAGAVDC